MSAKYQKGVFESRQESSHFSVTGEFHLDLLGQFIIQPFQTVIRFVQVLHHKYSSVVLIHMCNVHQIDDGVELGFVIEAEFRIFANG